MTTGHLSYTLQAPSRWPAGWHAMQPPSPRLKFYRWPRPSAFGSWQAASSPGWERRRCRGLRSVGAGRMGIRASYFVV